MIRPLMVLLMGCALAAPGARADEVADRPLPVTRAPLHTMPIPSAWPVAGSLKATLGNWAKRQGWPAPQFLTEADWPVDVPGSLPGSIEEALKMLLAGFDKAPLRPRIQIASNNVIVLTALEAR